MRTSSQVPALFSVPHLLVSTVHLVQERLPPPALFFQGSVGEQPQHLLHRSPASLGRLITEDSPVLSRRSSVCECTGWGGSSKLPGMQGGSTWGGGGRPVETASSASGWPWPQRPPSLCLLGLLLVFPLSVSASPACSMQRGLPMLLPSPRVTAVAWYLGKALSEQGVSVVGGPCAPDPLE